ncbi:hypothetical protein [Sulfurimonas sp. CS5]|uniref:hypothetical protein n=1 Tax=Sulfurimonas sp. CS5 TaxID=3391145 RepID=UPI0039EB8002
MHQILKRLELIKTSITIEDEEIIELQVAKLSTMPIDSDVQNILTKLSKSDYGSAVVEIENYIARFSGVVVYEDRELGGLKLELKVLEARLQELSEEKNEYLNVIHEFNVQYHLHLGGIIQKILNLKEELLFASMQKKKDIFEDIKYEYESLKMERDSLKSQKKDKEKELEDMDEFDDGYDELYEELQELKNVLENKEEELNKKRKETKQAKEEFEEDEATQEYEDIKRDSEEFSKEYEEVQKEERLEISDEEKKELKILFRKASKLCHPDIVSDELKEQANEIMQRLNEANSKRDINAVRKILAALESGNGFIVASDAINDKDLLRSKIVDIRDTIYQNEIDIEVIKKDEVIQILNDYEDVDDYFNRLETELETEYDRLKDSKDKEKRAIPAVDTDTDNYWKDEF